MTRTALAAVLLALGAIAAPGASRAADDAPPTLGATVQSIVYLNEGRTLAVVNRSTVPVRFSIEAADGLTASPATMDLEPDASGMFTLTGDAPDDGGHLSIHLAQLTEPVPGTEATGLTFGARVMQERPANWSGLALGLLLASLLMAAIATVWTVRYVRDRRPVRVR